MEETIQHIANNLRRLKDKATITINSNSIDALIKKLQYWKSQKSGFDAGCGLLQMVTFRYAQMNLKFEGRLTINLQDQGNLT